MAVKNIKKGGLNQHFNHQLILSFWIIIYSMNKFENKMRNWKKCTAEIYKGTAIVNRLPNLTFLCVCTGLLITTRNKICLAALRTFGVSW